MVCCADRLVCELVLKIGNAIAGLAGLFLLAVGLYLEFGGKFELEPMLDLSTISYSHSASFLIYSSPLQG